MERTAGSSGSSGTKRADLSAPRARAQALTPIVNIGKNGVTEGTLALLRRELKQKKLIKIKILKTVKDQADTHLATILAETGATLVQRIGNVVVLHKA